MFKTNIWYMWSGKWWMIQCCIDGWVSLGIHIDFKKRITGTDKLRYAPYIDFHILCFIISFGVNPARSTDYSVGRGGNV